MSNKYSGNVLLSFQRKLESILRKIYSPVNYQRAKFYCRVGIAHATFVIRDYRIRVNTEL